MLNNSETLNNVVPLLTDADYLSQWEAVMDLTAAMLDAGRGSNWIYVSELESERRPLYDWLVRKPIEPEHAAVVTRYMETILHMEQEVLRLGEARLEGLTEQLADFRRGRQASRAYAAPVG
ncbi:MAG: flagellar protein FliT [Gammaproteobacteria bacterium]|nr:flagellar protein FliT [Gammaproteobacteria bacterium]